MCICWCDSKYECVAFCYEWTFDTLWLLANEVVCWELSTNNECLIYLSHLVGNVS
jgi:hypothetical protein